MNNDNNFISKDDLLNIILNKKYFTIDKAGSIELDLNTKNQNCIGLFSCYGNMYCKGDFYISDNKSDNYVHINNQGTIECNNIKMNDKVLVGDFTKTQNQVKNSIVINASGNFINADKRGFYITPIRQELSKKILFYNSETSEITYYDSNIFIGADDHEGSQGKEGLRGPQGSIGGTGPQGSIGEIGPQGIAGDRFSTKTLNPVNITPYSSILQIQVEPGLSYIPGNSVIVVSSDISINKDLNSFEGIVYAYNKNNGNIVINHIVNIHGVFTGEHYYLVNIDGIDGPQGNIGPQGHTGPPGQIGPRGPYGPALKQGNVAIVDSVYGDDIIASIGSSSFRTLEAAINSISTNQTIYILPGYYNLKRGIIIPDSISIQGISSQTCIIQMLNVSSDTTLIKMKNNCCLENVTLILTSNGHYNLKGIVFEGTTGKLCNSIINVNNSYASNNEASIVIGVECNEIGTSNSLKDSIINIYSNGNGNKRGILVSNANLIITQCINIYIAQPTSTDSIGSYVGVETADPSNSGSIQMKSTTIETVNPIIGEKYVASDILQTNPVNMLNNSYLISPGIHIGPGTELVKKTAGSKGFFTYSYQTNIFYGLKGKITDSLSGGYLWPYTNQISSNTLITPPYFLIQQTSILCGLSFSLSTPPSSRNTITLLVQYTPISTGIVNDTIFTITLTGTELQSSFYNGSLTLNTGDKIHLYLTYTSESEINFSSDITAQINLF